MGPIYLDNAATSFPKPPAVAEAMAHYLNDVGASINRGVYASAQSAGLTTLLLREALCGLFRHTEATHCILTPGNTAGLNMAIRGQLGSGDHCLVSSMEHNAVMRPLQALAEEGIQVESPHYLPREDGRQAVVLTMRTQRGGKVSAEDAADMISVLLDRRLMPAADTPYVVEPDPQSFILEEEAGFLALTGFARATKEDETVSGDNYAVVESERGRVTVMLSDGTGSGERAGKDSERVLDLMEKMLEAGYDIDAAINMVNTALFAAGEDINHPTLDICDIDLYDGSCQLRKVGGAATFLKRGQEVERVAMGNLPLGIFGQMEILPVERRLQDGDYLIMVSDGVVDAFGEEYEDSMGSVIAGIQECSPGEIAERLLRFALCASGGRIRDDMTIGVIGIWTA